ncbi:hypothetical protein IMSAGC021_01381 [Muribaculaceae bacterium]|nr:hypothetical protein IMSAGC021_01381 [Muribaculaceae bacterium]
MSSNCHGNRRRVEFTKWLEVGGRLYISYVIGQNKSPKDFEPFQTRPGVASVTV